MPEEYRTPYPDDIIAQEISRGGVNTANMRIGFRQMKAAERQAAALEAIALTLAKIEQGLWQRQIQVEQLTGPQTDWNEHAKESEVSVLLKPEDLKPRRRRGSPTESPDVSELE